MTVAEFADVDGHNGVQMNEKQGQIVADEHRLDEESISPLLFLQPGDDFVFLLPVAFARPNCFDDLDFHALLNFEHLVQKL